MGESTVAFEVDAFDTRDVLGVLVGLVARTVSGLEGSRDERVLITGDCLKSMKGDFVGDFRCGGRLGRGGFQVGVLVRGSGELGVSGGSSGAGGESMC